MLHQRLRERAGFTIVELLIVIVVIAVLASITVTAFNGIQQRARNTQRAAAADAYVKMVRLYITQNGAYPFSANSCLGDTNPDTNSDGVGDCGTNGDTTQSNTLVTELKKVASSLPPVDFPAIQDGANKITGIRYNWSNSRTVDGKTRPLMILYYLEGNAQDCGRSDVSQDIGSGTTWKTGAKYTYTTAYKTSCYVSIGAPEEL